MVEVGPGRVLTGLARRIDPELTLVNVETPEGIEAAISKISATQSEAR
jgi:malonyl CoA-acyl carrier protein transacylase